jgi:hypothetical protein
LSEQLLRALSLPAATQPWPDLNTLSVRLVMAAAILFAFPTAVIAQLLSQEVDHESPRKSAPIETSPKS